MEAVFDACPVGLGRVAKVRLLLRKFKLGNLPVQTGSLGCQGFGELDPREDVLVKVTLGAFNVESLSTLLD